MQANDVVFFEWASELLAAASQLPKTCSIVTRLHRYEMYQWADRINWDVVDKVILVSKAMQQEFIDRFPQHAAKTFAVSPSTSLEKFSPASKQFNGDIGILCHLTPRKRVYDLILTFYELTRQNEPLHLHIAGGPHPAYQDYYNALHRIVKKLNLQNNVTFYGNLTDTAPWYHKIDVFISNSYSEGLQVAPMEAMASGRYCLSHHWNGAEELLPKSNLFYTSDQLQKKILDYCAMPEAEKSAWQQKMRSIAFEKFDIKQTITQIHQVIKEAYALPAVENGHAK
jgi:glycosyltransferase involved in cell wall biosynthesis